MTSGPSAWMSAIAEARTLSSAAFGALLMVLSASASSASLRLLMRLACSGKPDIGGSPAAAVSLLVKSGPGVVGGGVPALNGGRPAKSALGVSLRGSGSLMSLSLAGFTAPGAFAASVAGGVVLSGAGVAGVSATASLGLSLMMVSTSRRRIDCVLPLAVLTTTI